MKTWVRSGMHLVTNWYASGYELVSPWLRNGMVRNRLVTKCQETNLTLEAIDLKGQCWRLFEVRVDDGPGEETYNSKLYKSKS